MRIISKNHLFQRIGFFRISYFKTVKIPSPQILLFTQAGDTQKLSNIPTSRIRILVSTSQFHHRHKTVEHFRHILREIFQLFIHPHFHRLIRNIVLIKIPHHTFPQRRFTKYSPSQSSSGKLLSILVKGYPHETLIIIIIRNTHIIHILRDKLKGNKSAISRYIKIPVPNSLVFAQIHICHFPTIIIIHIGNSGNSLLSDQRSSRRIILYFQPGSSHRTPRKTG